MTDAGSGSTAYDQPYRRLTRNLAQSPKAAEDAVEIANVRRGLRAYSRNEKVNHSHLVARIGRLASKAGRCSTTPSSRTLGPPPCRSKPKRLVAITFRSSGTG